MRRLALAILLAFLGTAVFGQAATADEPKVPEDVAAYFATGLIPRLADLYGSPGSPDPDSTFDATTKVGTIQRLLAWTPDFLAGHKTDNPTELTNTWIAPVTAKSGLILGLAAVWINPGNNVVELADFSRGRALVDALGRAPKDTQLIDDTVQQAWFATDGKTLTPLVAGKSGADGPLTPAEYQTILHAKAVPTKAPDSATNPGLLIAGITLGAVVLLLAVFILLPGRKRKGEPRDAVATPRRNPRDESDKAFDRQASRTEARATVRARAAISAEAGLVDAIAGSRATAASTSKPTLVPEPNPAPASASAPEPGTAPASGSGRPARPFVPDDAPAPQKAPPARKSAARKPAARKPEPDSPATVKPVGGTPATGASAARKPTVRKATPPSADGVPSVKKATAVPKATTKTAPKAAPKKAAPKKSPSKPAE
jgi:hypothetical protein